MMESYEARILPNLGSSTSTLINVTPQDDINIVLANVAGTVEAPVDVTLAFDGRVGLQG